MTKQLFGLLLLIVVTCCYGIPTREDILSAIERARIHNTRQKREVTGTRQGRACPHMTRHGHGKRYTRNVHDANNANDIIKALQLLKEENDDFALQGVTKVIDQLASCHSGTSFHFPNMVWRGLTEYRWKRGHSLEDLQHNDVKRALQEQTTGCPVQPTCTSPTINRYRTADGSCNNVDNPGWGQAGRQQTRLKHAAYVDGISTPRSESVLGGKLPNTRTISNIVHAAPMKPLATRKSKKNTLHIMQMGQFLDHDIALTPALDIDCCSVEGREDIDNCLPIIVPENDPRFEDGYCMNFPRSSPMLCPFESGEGYVKKRRDLGIYNDGLDPGPAPLQRQQANLITSYIDASNVYGSDEEETNKLRVVDDTGVLTAFLRTEVGNRLPDNDDQTVCRSNVTAGIMCSLAGDERVNEQPALTTYHTLFVREHNRIASQLSQYYPDQEKLFQETRKILIAVIQKIVYDEFLPAFLSPAAMRKYELATSNRYSYKPEVDATILNEFGIAYRMGHSWIPEDMNLHLINFKLYKEFKLETTYFDPYLTYITRDPNVKFSVNGMEGLAYYLSSVYSPKVDRFIEDSARNNLFLDDEGNAFDLVARNIQRERDHGLQTYNEYRIVCDLSELPLKWNDEPMGGMNNHKKETVDLLREVYVSPRDIDLYTGALTEEPVAGGELGPTLECILGEQFKRLKQGDRFWFQNREGVENAFTREQQAEIQKASMARILCDNMSFFYVHENAFIKKRKRTCIGEVIPKMKLSKFAPTITYTD